jgi:hypothetical protein
VTDLEALVIEWRDARQAVLDSHADADNRNDLWADLADAEHALMAMARTLVDDRKPNAGSGWVDPVRHRGSIPLPPKAQGESL